MSPPPASSAQVERFPPGVICRKVKWGILLLAVAHALARPGRYVAILLDDFVSNNAVCDSFGGTIVVQHLLKSFQRVVIPQLSAPQNFRFNLLLGFLGKNDFWSDVT
jgi:hypothetical protein